MERPCLVSPNEKQKIHYWLISLLWRSEGETEALALLDEFALHTSAFFPFTDNGLSDMQDCGDENPPRLNSNLQRQRLCSGRYRSSPQFTTFRSSLANQQEVACVFEVSLNVVPDPKLTRAYEPNAMSPSLASDQCLLQPVVNQREPPRTSAPPLKTRSPRVSAARWPPPPPPPPSINDPPAGSRTAAR